MQYVVVRGDLQKDLGWPTGALIAQACHASAAVTHLFYDHANTKTYLSDLDRMHKVLLLAKDETSLTKLSEILTTNDIDHKLWIEQPENIATCLAVKPYQKADIQKYFKKFKLFK